MTTSSTDDEGDIETQTFDEESSTLLITTVLLTTAFDDAGAGLSLTTEPTLSLNSDDLEDSDAGSSSGTNTGAIVGGVVGGLAVISGFGLGLAFLVLRYRRRKREIPTEASSESDKVFGRAHELPIAEISDRIGQLRTGHESVEVSELSATPPTRLSEIK